MSHVADAIGLSKEAFSLLSMSKMLVGMDIKSIQAQSSSKACFR